MKWASATCALAALLAILPALPADAERLMASISRLRVPITSNFTGVELVVFGTVERDAATEPGQTSYDIVATATGPRENLVTRRKARVFGIWVNAESRTFVNVPSYLAVLSTRPLESIADAPTLRRLHVGVDNTALPQQTGRNVADGSPDDPFRRAFLRIKREQSMFSEAPDGVTFLTPTLYRASILVPADAQIGTYDVDVKLFADGAMIATAGAPFEIVKVGFERFITASAVDHGILYGLATAAMAVMTGWLASIAFRRD